MSMFQFIENAQFNLRRKGQNTVPDFGEFVTSADFYIE